MNSVLLLILFVRFFWFLKLRVQCQYTLFSYVVSYNIPTLCCKVVLGWPRPNAINDEENKWGDLVYRVPEALKKRKKIKIKNNNKTEQDTEQDKQTQILVEQLTYILTQYI